MLKSLLNPRVFLAGLALSVLPNLANALPEGDPIITFHTRAYEEVGEGNQFSMFMSTYSTSVYTVDMGDYVVEFDVEPGTVNVDEDTWDGTWMPIVANADGYVSIYGDPENISVLSIDGGYIDNIDFTACQNLEVLSLQHNVLEDLDLTGFTNLYAIYLSDNPFTGSRSLTIGNDKPYLAILEMDIIEKIADGFNLSDYPELRVFDGYYNFGLKQVDVSGCPELLALSLEMTPVETLDVSNNTKLLSLNISESRITDIDISNNEQLQIFLAGHDSGWQNVGYRLNSVDLSHNPNLYYLSVSGNHLGSLDLSNNTMLTHLMAGRNDLKELDLSANTELYSVSVSFNDLDFATLPMPQATWGEYWYIQNNLSLPRSISQDEVVDLSSRVLRENTVTTASLWASPIGGEDYMLDETYYDYDNGRFSIKTIPTDSVYMKFANDVFYEYPLTTTKFKVKNPDDMGKPSCIVSMQLPQTTSNIRMAVGIGGATSAAPQKFYMEMSDGSLVEFSSKYSDSPMGVNLDITAPAAFNGEVNIFIPEGEVMTSLTIADMEIESIDLSGATELRYLSLTGCGLDAIDLSTNRCLQYIDLSGNNLTELDLQAVYGNYAKNFLTTIKASHNKLSKSDSFKYNDTTPFHYIDFSYNELESFDLKAFDNLEYVDLSHNKLCEETYLTFQITASHIDLSYNNISSLVIDEFTNLEYLDISNNVFPFSTMPLASEIEAQNFVYAPQKRYSIPENGPSVDLSAQMRQVDDFTTNFEWLKADGTPLVEGTDYTFVDGTTKFLNAETGPVYCKMTNLAFPELTGENVYMTTEITPTLTPTQLVASFTTTKSTTGGDVTFAASQNTVLYIDWTGNGGDLMPYPVETTYISYPKQTTYAGANVKIYTFDSADIITVFSITGIGMRDADLSPLTGLQALNLSGSGLAEANVVMPESAPLSELSMSSCKLTSFPWADCFGETLTSLNLSRNGITSFDASGLKALQTLMITNNGLTDITFDNPHLWGLGLSSNSLTSIDLSGLPALDQLDLADNKMTSIDITPVSSTLMVLQLNGNCFNFSSLPVASEYPHLSYYTYGGQAQLNAECEEGKIDLSFTAVSADGVPTVYYWFLGEAVYDSTNYEWTGTALVEGEDYVMENGLTTFLHPLDEPVMCLLTNDTFPNLLLKTGLITVTNTGITDAVADNGLVDVYTVMGVLVKGQVPVSEATDGLLPGCYVIGNKKVYVR